MRIRPFHIWLVSFAACTALLVLVAPTRVFLALALCAHLPVFAWGVFDIRSRFFCDVLVHAPELRDRIALTFDDGPEPLITPQILEILKQHRVKATFFVIGVKAKQHPDIVRQIHAAGHVVACHDLTHGSLGNFRMRRRLVRDIGRAAAIVEEIIGRRPALYRPPVGLTNPHLAGALKRLGMRCVGWSRSARESGNRREDRLGQIGDLARGGEVVLLHDTLPVEHYRRQLLHEIDRLCLNIEKLGLRAVSIDELFGVAAYSSK